MTGNSVVFIRYKEVEDTLLYPLPLILFNYNYEDG